MVPGNFSRFRESDAPSAAGILWLRASGIDT
jgi:hypothetical protein